MKIFCRNPINLQEVHQPNQHWPVMYSLYRAWLSLNHHCSQLPPPPPAGNHLLIIDPSSTATATTTTEESTATGGNSSASPLNLTNHHHHHHHQQQGLSSAAAAPGDASTTIQPPSQPDVCLQVGATLTSFNAHRAVLTAHSGYFKAALATHTGPGPIHVPNVNVEEFSALLTFMYTGYLDLNTTNIYNILLATHMLHMPRALEICRTYLINHQQQQQQQQPSTTTTTHGHIIKPIASRRQLVVGQVFAPIYSNLEKSESTPFKVVERRSSTAQQHQQQKGPNKQQQQQQQASTSKLVDEKRVVNKSTAAVRKDSSNSKVIIDIACCDGPVRFHRVVNKHYGHTAANVENAPNNNNNNNLNKNAALNKVMQENITKQRRTDDDTNKTTTTDLFTCLYCNHTFKSQYCYQKHARRHLNPVVDLGPAGGGTITTNNSVVQKISAESARREVRLLDMNVQYYPCKTCGSKFPSYYFVHKHRKLCHADEMADNDNKNNEMVVHNPEVVGRDEGEHSSCGNSSKNSVIIDVEETDGTV